MGREIYTTSYAIGSPYCSINHHDSKFGIWREGHYTSILGRVEIYADPKVNVTTFDIYHNGRHYYRAISGPQYSDRGLAIMAGKFQREILNANND